MNAWHDFVRLFLPTANDRNAMLVTHSWESGIATPSIGMNSRAKFHRLSNEAVLIQRNWHFSDLHRSPRRSVLFPNIPSFFSTDCSGILKGRFSVFKPLRDVFRALQYSLRASGKGRHADARDYTPACSF